MRAIRPPGEGCTRLSVLLTLLIAAEAVVCTPRSAAQSIEDPYWNRFIEDAYGNHLSLTAGSNLTLTGTIASAPTGGGGGSLLAPDATFIWSGGSGANANLWNHAANWTPSGPPTINDTAQFDNTANSSNLAPSIGSTATSVGAILFAAGTTNAYNISGTATLTLGSASASGIINASGTNQTISVPIALGVTQTWDVQGAGNLSISGTVATGGFGLTIQGSNTGQGTISGIISGTGSLTKTGTGTWTLSAANTYSGGTTVNAGTLLVNNTSGSGTGTGPVTVNNSGTTLGGTGTISGATTLAAGTDLSPGNGPNIPGHLTVSGVLTLSAGANFLVTLNGTTQGTQYTFLTGPGNPNFHFNGSNLILNVGFATTTSETFTIVHNGGGFGGQQFAQGTAVVGSDEKVYSITYSGDSIILQWTGTVVPEPGTWFGGALAVAALALTQRRRFVRGLSRLRLPIPRPPSAI